MAAQPLSPDPFTFWSWFHQKPLLCCWVPCCWTSLCSSGVVPLHDQHSAHTWLGQCLAPVFLPECTALVGLFVALQTHPRGWGSSGSRKELVVSVLRWQGTLQRGWVFCRKRETEVFHRAKTDCLTHHPRSGSVLLFSIRYLELLHLLAILIYYKLSTHFIIYFIFQSSFLHLFDYDLNLKQRKMRPQDSHVRCRDQGRFLGMDSFGSSETEVAPQSSWMCFRDHQSGKEFRCTFLLGLLELALCQVEFMLNCVLREEKRRVLFSIIQIFFCFFQRGYKILQKLQMAFFFIHLNFVYSFGPFRGFFSLWFPYYESAVFRIICWEDHVLQWDSAVCGCSCQDDIPEMSRFK